MFNSRNGLVLSATDLSNSLACSHLLELKRSVALGAPGPPKYDDPAGEALRLRGEEHEKAVRQAFEADGIEVVEIAEPDGPFSAERCAGHAEATIKAMSGGAHVIFQGALFDGRWFGRPDFIRRVEGSSRFGDWAYEVVDAKLAREAKAGALLQVLLYCDLLERAQQATPEFVHLALGGPEARTEPYRVHDYAAYFRLVRSRIEQTVTDAVPDPFPLAPDPVEHCVLCDWSVRCDAERREVDHLSLVAGISRKQRDALRTDGIDRLADLATLPLPPATPPEGIGPDALLRIREQARVQLEGRLEDRDVHELIEPIDPEQGFSRLPEPRPGDLFLDLEGNSYALTHGLEYLFGFVDGEGEYTGWWAFDRGSEKEAFERFIDLVLERLAADPGIHVYHYAPYELSAFRRLMGFHGTREDEIDRLLRAGVFVDLYRVVRGSLRASVESYSIKKLEPFYGYKREMNLRQASRAKNRFDALLEAGLFEDERDQLTEVVRKYNQDDCISTLRLRDWLEELRAGFEARSGETIPRPPIGDGSAPENLAQSRAEVAERMEALLAGVPSDPEERSEEEQGRWLLAQLLDFHRREDKAFWWEHYRCLDLAEDEWVEDRSVLGGLEYVGPVGTVKKSTIHRYRFPPQDHTIRVKTTVKDPATRSSAGTVEALDNDGGTVDLKRGNRNEAPHPNAIIAAQSFDPKVIRESILRVADRVIAHGFGETSPCPAVGDLLLRRHPRTGQAAGQPLLRDGETPLDGALRIAGRLDRTVLPIQGPPGAGKTYTGGRMIAKAVAEGKKVGVTALSHKVIANLLQSACEAAKEMRVELKGIQKGREGDFCSAPEITRTGDDIAVLDALESGSANVAAGTAWLWSREEMTGSVDILFIDEAGQFPLANALAVAPAASSVVLLGDPRQLEQPLQGVHPDGAAASALDHLLGSDQTLSADRGLFLPTTWRLNPAICDFTSEVYYENRLKPRQGLERQQVSSKGSLNGAGLRFVPVSHSGNQSEAREEVEAIRRIVDGLLAGDASWVDGEGQEHALSLDDVLIVTPYNAQLGLLKEALPPGARVGTVDKFQGQQAPISIYSVATSTAVEAPRGMDFLYNPNRLNVATSRARCLTILVANPEVFSAEAKSPEQMRLANGFCRFRELAEEVEL